MAPLQLKVDRLHPLPEIKDVRLLAQFLDGLVLDIEPGLDVIRICLVPNASSDASPADAFLGRLDDLLHARVLGMSGREGGIELCFVFGPLLSQRGLNVDSPI